MDFRPAAEVRRKSDAAIRDLIQQYGNVPDMAEALNVSVAFLRKELCKRHISLKSVLDWTGDNE